MIGITEHAVERYQRRIRPDLTMSQSRERLERLATQAYRLRERTPYGELRFQIEDAVLVVKETRDAGLQAVTVYPPPVYADRAPSVETLQALVGTADDAGRLAGECRGTTGSPDFPPPFPIPDEDMTVLAAVARLDTCSDALEAARSELQRKTAVMNARAAKAEATSAYLRESMEIVRAAFSRLMDAARDKAEVQRILGVSACAVLMLPEPSAITDTSDMPQHDAGERAPAPPDDPWGSPFLDVNLEAEVRRRAGPPPTRGTMERWRASLERIREDVAKTWGGPTMRKKWRDDIEAAAAESGIALPRRKLYR